MKKPIITLSLLVILTACGNTNEKAIDGLNGSEVAYALEQEGYTVTKNSDLEKFSADCKQSIDGIDYSVYIYGTRQNEIESVTFTAFIGDGHSSLESLLLEKYVATVPYTTADADKAAKWVTENYDKKKATTVIGDAKFTITAPTEIVRTLKITKK